MNGITSIYDQLQVLNNTDEAQSFFFSLLKCRKYSILDLIFFNVTFIEIFTFDFTWTLAMQTPQLHNK